MKTIKKAIIPAAGLGTRYLPATISCPKEMLTIVDKPVIQYVIEEAVSAGIEEILIITRPGKETIEKHFNPSKDLHKALKKKDKTKEIALLNQISRLAKISFVIQKEQKGLADAIYCGKDFAGNEPFAVLSGDTIIDGSGIGQLVNHYQEFGKAAVLLEYLTNKSEVEKYGIIKPLNKTPHKSQNGNRYFDVLDLIEKPAILEAPSRYSIASRYVFGPEIFSLIKKTTPGKGGELQITDSMRFLAHDNKLSACISDDAKYDIGGKVDFVRANIDFALKQLDIKDQIFNHIRKKSK